MRALKTTKTAKIVLLLVWVALVWQNGQPAQASEASLAEQAITLYRQGHYQQAAAQLEPLHQAHPEDAKLTYYLAISYAQLGRTPQAKALYEEVLLLDPNGPAAPLAKQGLSYLPTQPPLDLPPKLQAASPSVQPSTASVQNPSQPTPENAGNLGTLGNNNNQAMQQWMLMQSMMGQAGGGGQSNPMAAMMPWLMMNGVGGGGLPGQEGNGPAMDPKMMSQFLMNSMMSNMDFSSSSDKDR